MAQHLIDLDRQGKEIKTCVSSVIYGENVLG